MSHGKQSPIPGASTTRGRLGEPSLPRAALPIECQQCGGGIRIGGLLAKAAEDCRSPRPRGHRKRRGGTRERFGLRLTSAALSHAVRVNRPMIGESWYERKGDTDDAARFCPAHQGWPLRGPFPRALPWAGLLPDLWPSSRRATSARKFHTPKEAAQSVLGSTPIPGVGPGVPPGRTLRSLVASRDGRRCWQRLEKFVLAGTPKPTCEPSGAGQTCRRQPAGRERSRASHACAPQLGHRAFYNE